MIPRQDLVEGTAAVGVKRRVYTALLEDIEPITTPVHMGLVPKGFSRSETDESIPAFSFPAMILIFFVPIFGG